MQLSLLKRPAPHRDDERAGAASTLPGAWRDSAISQLDALAAANDRRAATRLRQQAAAFALMGLVALAAAVGWMRGQGPATVVAPVAPSARGPVAPPAPAPVVPTPAAPAAVPARAPLPTAAPAASAAAAVVPPAPAARVRAPAVVRRTQDDTRARAVAPPREAAASAEAPPARTGPVAAAEAAPRSAAVVVPAAPAPHADVRSACAGRGLLAARFCEAQECRKAQHQSDPVCVQLRETERARERAAADR